MTYLQSFLQVLAIIDEFPAALGFSLPVHGKKILFRKITLENDRFQR